MLPRAEGGKQPDLRAVRRHHVGDGGERANGEIGHRRMSSSNFFGRSKKILDCETFRAYVRACPNSHVPVVAQLSEGEPPGKIPDASKDAA